MGFTSLFKSSDTCSVASGHSLKKSNTESQLESVTELTNTNQRVDLEQGSEYIPSDELSISDTLKIFM